jgi:transforming growth factor-beta-induced protein
MKKIQIILAAMMVAALPGFVIAGGYEKTQGSAESMMKMDIVDTAVSAGKFNTLVKAVQAADLAETLKSPGPFTVFAPTDEAFAKLPAGTLTDLLKPENKAKLQSILTYHVVAGNVMSTDAVKLTSAKTVNGESFSIRSGSNGLMVDEATVIKADIKASNGIIHMIDRVILP